MASLKYLAGLGTFVIIVTLIKSTVCFTSAADFYDDWQVKFPEYAARLYPFGEEYHDTTVKSGVSYELGFEFDMPFFGKSYKEGHISSFGAISFSPDTPYYEKLKLLPNMNHGSGSEIDFPMVNVYYADAELSGAPLDPGRMHWRYVNPLKETEQIKIDIAMAELETFQQEISQSVIGAQDFMPTFAWVATWEKILFKSCFDDLDKCPTNTYQLVLASDGLRTYSILTYFDVQWENAPRDDCDTKLGTTTEAYPNCFSAQVGFNAGEGRQFYALPYSNTADVVKLDELGGRPGRFVYDVTGEQIHRGGCFNKDDMTELPGLEIWPRSVFMLGGDLLQIQGTCFDPNVDVVSCKFGDEDGDVIDGIVANEMFAACTVPPLTATGNVPVYITTQGQTQMINMNVENHRRRQPQVKLDNIDDWMMMDAEMLSLSWDPNQLVISQYMTLMNVSSLRIGIDLYGYRESEHDGENEIEWQKVHTLTSDMDNSGKFAFAPVDHRCALDDCEWHIGAIKIYVTNMLDPEQFMPRGIWTRVIPLGWFIADAMSNIHGDDWPFALCNNWHEEEREPELQPCPCTVNQAKAPQGSFIVDPDCGEDGSCLLQPNAQICLYSVLPGSNGEASRCCYNTDGNLMYAGDLITSEDEQSSSGGSYHDRAHVDGVYPYNKPGKVPDVSNWIQDKLGFLWCCNWAENTDGCIAHFMTRRQTPDCVDYGQQGHAFAYGDPHFRTFDGFGLTFNGRGEYNLMSSTSSDSMLEMNLQARMESPDTNSVVVSATIITAIVMKSGSMSSGVPVVELRLNTYDLYMGRPPTVPISVIVDGVEQDFTNTAGKRFYGSGSESQRHLLIARNDAINGYSGASNITVFFDNGVSINAADQAGLLHVIVSLPPEFKDLTQGIFGIWNNDIEDDLKNRAGVVIPTDSTDEIIFEQFGRTWEITEEESLFTYMAALTWNDYRQDENYLPVFTPQIQASSFITENEVDSLCGENFVCRYDYISTMVAAIGQNSMETQSWAKQVETWSAEAVTCGRLDTLYAEKTFTNYLEGGQVTFTGCMDGYQLRGNEQYLCTNVAGGTWSPNFNTYCKSDAEISSEKSKMAAAIAVPIILIALIAILCLAFVVIYRKRQQDKGHYIGEKEGHDNNIDVPDAMPKSLSAYPNPHAGGENVSLSTSTMTMSSVGSVILNEELRSARPPRPRKQPKTNGQVIANSDALNRIDAESTGLDLRQQSAPPGHTPVNTNNNAATPSSKPPIYDNIAAQIDDDHRHNPAPYRPTFSPPTQTSNSTDTPV